MAASGLVAAVVLGAVAIDGPAADEPRPVRVAAAGPAARASFAGPVAFDPAAWHGRGDEARAPAGAPAAAEPSRVAAVPRAPGKGAVAFTSWTNRYGSSTAMTMLVWPCAP